MDVQDELGGGHHHDHTHVIKGKRTKRQRSPLVAAATATSTSSSTGGIGGGAAVSEDYNSAVSSPATTAISSAPSTDCTEEEEDMAICLIMLANGGGPPLDMRNTGKSEKVHKNSERIQIENSNFYVYGCKTCNRTFASFQALGGHRASHKKPRTTGDEKTKLPLTTALKLNSSEEGKICPPPTKISAVPAVTTSQTSNTTNNNKSSKIHECSICGSEFTSGQALGGHMRRHRVATAAVATGESTNSPVGLINTEETENVDRPIEPRKFLPLDLNLPAPEDDLRESKFQGLVFSATPALVDCHY